MDYNFLYTSDSQYFNYMYISIYSLLKNNNYRLTVHIIESEFTIEQKEKLERLFNLYPNASLKLYSINSLNKIMSKFSIPKWRGTDIANARLFSHEIIDVDKILYIDSDTIISSSLKNIFNINNVNPISAVREVIIPEHLKNNLDKYYNSGVLLIDYNICDSIDYFKLIFDSINNNSIRLFYPDQDILNISLNGNIGDLKPSYNINPIIYDMLFKYPILTKKYFINHQNIFYNIDDLISSYNEPHIYHLLNYLHSRPWIKNSIHPFNDIYNKYSEESLGYLSKETFDNKTDMILTSSSIFPMLSILLQIMPYSEETNLKEKIKKIVYKDRK